MTYKPRKCSKRWLDADCPDGVLCILDHPQFGDRYTVIYSEPVIGESYADMVLWGRGMSENPSSPQGIGMSFEMSAHGLAEYRYRNKHRYTQWSKLPESVKNVVRRDLEVES